MKTEMENCLQEVHWASSQQLINPWKTEIALMCGSERYRLGFYQLGVDSSAGEDDT